jgi:N-terminal domain of ribose phosphate pyrophosphokinase
MKDGFTILSGTANPPLASAIAAELGVQLGECAIDRYPDGEIAIQLLEPVRRREVYLVQPMAPPVNDNLVELLALADACRRAAAPGSRRLSPISLMLEPTNATIPWNPLPRAWSLICFRRLGLFT